MRKKSRLATLTRNLSLMSRGEDATIRHQVSGGVGRETRVRE
jgi:hypothetical protein